MNTIIRRARIEDRAQVLQVEAQSTPNLRYLHAVFEHWVHDRQGELIVAERAGSLVGVGKLTVVPDGSAWLEALRVVPKAQGQGIGKLFYQRFLAIARERNIHVLRMYTGVKNATSRGLAERHGFSLAASFRGAALDLTTAAPNAPVGAGFQQVTSTDQATELLLALQPQWGDFLVMNRTFYALSPALCAAWAEESKVYHNAANGSTLALGARFLADQALHIACCSGNWPHSLEFAAGQARARSIPKLQCLFPADAADIQQLLIQAGFRLDPSDYIVMEAQLWS